MSEDSRFNTWVLISDMCRFAAMALNKRKFVLDYRALTQKPACSKRAGIWQAKTKSQRRIRANIQLITSFHFWNITFDMKTPKKVFFGSGWKAKIQRESCHCNKQRGFM